MAIRVGIAGFDADTLGIETLRIIVNDLGAVGNRELEIWG